MSFDVAFLQHLATAYPERRADLCRLIDQTACQQDQHIQNDLLKEIIFRHARQANEIRHLNHALSSAKTQLEKDLEAAAVIQKTLLPQTLPPLAPFEAAWCYLPCEQVGGDLVNVSPLDDRRSLFYILDVAGHGPRAAMITVALAQFLKPGPGNPHLPFDRPSRMIAALDQAFPFQRFNSFFTIIYGVISPQEGTLTFVNAGHPFPVHYQPRQKAVFLEEHGGMVGLPTGSPPPEVSIALSEGESVLFYTDGIPECPDGAGGFFGEDALLRIPVKEASTPEALVKWIQSQVQAICGNRPPQDDVTMLSIGFPGK